MPRYPLQGYRRGKGRKAKRAPRAPKCNRATEFRLLLELLYLASRPIQHNTGRKHVYMAIFPAGLQVVAVVALSTLAKLHCVALRKPDTG